MHAAGAAPTDSMRMYQWDVEGGRPALGEVKCHQNGLQGTGTLRAHSEPLVVPAYAEDGGDNQTSGCTDDRLGVPRRLGMTIGNEFSDHRLEKRNYLYLASSKLRNCAIGPELVIDPEFDSVHGEVAIERAGNLLWSRSIHTGDAAMCHSLANIEHHHFKHEAHRQPGDFHVHFLGAAAFSFGEGIELRTGDIMQVNFAGYGRPLRNPVSLNSSSVLVCAKGLTNFTLDRLIVNTQPNHTCRRRFPCLVLTGSCGLCQTHALHQ